MSIKKAQNSTVSPLFVLHLAFCRFLLSGDNGASLLGRVTERLVVIVVVFFGFVAVFFFLVSSFSILCLRDQSGSNPGFFFVFLSEFFFPLYFAMINAVEGVVLT